MAIHESPNEDANVNAYRTPCGLVVAQTNKLETEFVYREVFVDQVYFRHGISLQAGDCVFDVGANIGLFTIFVQEKYPGVQVYAFEPSPAIFGLLRTNTAKYGDAVRPYQCGLSSEKKQAVFTFYPRYTILSGFRALDNVDTSTIRAGFLNDWRERRPGRPDPEDRIIDALAQETLAEKVEMICELRTISDILQEADLTEISLLKIDAEGCELDILSGIQGKDWPKIRQIVMEIHNSDATTLPAIEAILTERGFRCSLEEERHLRGAGIVNCYAIRS